VCGGVPPGRVGDADGFAALASSDACGWSPANVDDAAHAPRRAATRRPSLRNLGAKPRRCHRSTCTTTSTAMKRASKPNPSSMARLESAPGMLWAATVMSWARASLGAPARGLGGPIGVALRATCRRVGVASHARGRDPPRALAGERQSDRVADDEVERRRLGGVCPRRLDRGDLPNHP